MTDAVFSADFVTFKHLPSRRVFQIVCEVPIEQANDVLKMLGMPNAETGTPVAIARLEIGRGSLPSSALDDGSGRGGAPTSPGTPSGEGQGPNNPRPSLAQEAYRYTLKPGFIQWLNCITRDNAEAFIEGSCGINSLSELDDNKEAQRDWERIKAEFKTSGFDRAA